MPRGKKNKRRSRMKNKNHHHEKCHDEKDESQDQKGEMDSEAEEEKPLCSVTDDIHGMSPASESSSNTECCSCVPSPVSISGDDIEFDHCQYCCGEGNFLHSECQLCHDNSFRDCLDMYVDFVEQTVLYKFKMKQPITREDLLSVIDPKYRYRFAEIFKKAFERIEIVFAVDVVEIDSTNHLYDLVSKIELPNKGRVCAGRGLPKTGLLMTLLAMIFLKGNSIAEEEVWKFLKTMQVYPGRKHFIYREPRKFITQDLVKLKYLEYQQIPNSDPPRYEFLWGPKAYVETTKIKVLEFVAKGSDTKLNKFFIQY
ncbi:melanoma-associated antigen B5-like [Mesocricetus auratus]|uniref:Melanoma-associated antigen B5-like n=1 Tax=Mesocricetus auratus TaxID=10036 RepID=A0A1U8C946_MESAU|nr:melanoma-associated antigen B5-like [Mesocricetus auratus]